MYYLCGLEEYVSVVGTDAFTGRFVESIQAEGVVLERKPMERRHRGNCTPTAWPGIISDNGPQYIDKGLQDIEAHLRILKSHVLTPRVLSGI